MGDWTLTDNPADPCSLCVQWTDAEEIEDSVPYFPSGPVERLYRGVHVDCAAVVSAMQAERGAEHG